MIRQSTIMATLLVLTSCSARVPESMLVGTYDVPDHAYSAHRVSLLKDGTFSESFTLASGRSFTNTGRWECRSLDSVRTLPSVQRVTFHGGMMYAGSALMDDFSNATALKHDAEYDVTVQWGRLRLCQDGCDLVYGAPDGKLVAVSLEKTD